MVKYGENKGILCVKSPSIRFINKKDKGKIFSMQSIKDNVSLLDAETINKINEVVVRTGHQLVKKKDRPCGEKGDP